MEYVGIFIGLLSIPCISFLVLYLVSKKSNNNCSKTGFDVARSVLDSNGLSDMYIVEIKGLLGDHYDYDQKVVRLSTSVYNGNSVFANVMALYIAGFALLARSDNSYFKIRNLLNNIINFFTYIVLIVFVIGIVLSMQLVMFACLMLLVIFLYYIYCMYGTYLNIKRIKEILVEDKELIGKSLWVLYLYDFSSMIVNVINVVNEFISDSKKGR